VSNRRGNTNRHAGSNDDEAERGLRVEVVGSLDVRRDAGWQRVRAGRDRSEPVTGQEKQRRPGDDEQHRQRVPQSVRGVYAAFHALRRDEVDLRRNSKW